MPEPRTKVTMLGATGMLGRPVGKGKHPQWFIAGDDYASQVARSFRMETAVGREYPVQGPEPLLTEDAAEIFVRNHPRENLRISRVPLWPLRIAGLFSRKHADLRAIIEALNEYPESFQSDATWKELGEPRTTMTDFARRPS